MSVDLNKELTGVPATVYGSDYNAHLLEEYKLYVGMADKISERRQTANTFFLAINSAVITALGIAWPADVVAVKMPWFFVAATVGGLLCLSWYRLLKSHKDLNSAKFTIIGKLEELLPVRPYAAEWKLVGEGKVSRLYLPFTHIETKIPCFFMMLYVGLAIIVPLTQRNPPVPEKAQTTVFVEGNSCSSLPPTSAQEAKPKSPALTEEPGQQVTRPKKGKTL